MIIKSMIDFVKLVTSCYSCEGQIVLESITTPSPFNAFYDDSNEFGELRNYFNNTFGIQIKWPNSTSLFPILRDTFVRTRAESLIPFAEIYPLIDFVWYVVERSPKQTQILDLSGTSTMINMDPNQVNKFAEDFKTSSSSNNAGANLHPLFGYVPTSAKATANLRPLQKKITNNQIGQLNLDQFNQQSLRKALYGILEIRRKVRASVLKNKPIPNSIRWIDGILENPANYAGQIQIPNEIKVLYDRVTGQQLVELSDVMHDFFNSEKAIVTNVPAFSGEEIINPFMHFASNEDAEGGEYTFFFRNGSSTPSVSLSGSDGGYTIENIKTINTPQAKEVIQELTSLANFVSEGEPTDIAGTLQGLNKIAKGLSLGVPTMGG